MRSFDVVVLGGGSAEELVAGNMANAGYAAALVEERLVGGECPFVACMPSKAMLNAAYVRHTVSTAHETGGTGRPLSLDDPAEAYRAATDWRRQVVDNLDDSGHVIELENAGVEVVRGRGRVTGPGQLKVNGETLRWDDLVLSTGTVFREPPIPGLEDVPTWTSEDLYTSRELPGSVLVLGGGPIGCEASQVLARFGCKVTLLELEPRLLPAEEPAVADLLAEVLRSDGVDVKMGVKAIKAEPTALGARLLFEDGTVHEAERILVAAGKIPHLEGLGLESLGIVPVPAITSRWTNAAGCSGRTTYGRPGM